MGKNNCFILFENYKLNNDEDTFLELYKSIEGLLKKVITDVTYAYKGTEFESQKYSKIYSARIRNGTKINISHLLEKYKDEYIKQVYCEDYDKYKNRRYSLLVPFWELVNRLSITTAIEYMDKYNSSLKWYLVMKFADMYWLHIEKCLRRDFPTSKNKYKKIEEISFEKCIESSGDMFLYNNSLFNCLDTLLFANDLLGELKKVLSRREKQVLELLLLGYDHLQISVRLNISSSNSAKIKCCINNKLKILLDVDGYCN